MARDPGSKPDNTTRTPFMRQPDVKHSQNRIMPLSEHPSMSAGWEAMPSKKRNTTKQQTSNELASATSGYGPRQKIEHKETPTPVRPPGQKGKVGYKRGRG